MVNRPALATRFLQVVEKFLVGGSTRIMRRDLRSGDCRTQAQAAADGVIVTAQWGAPYAGHVRESYLCPEPDVLHVESTITVGERSATTLQVRGLFARLGAQIWLEFGLVWTSIDSKFDYT